MPSPIVLRLGLWPLACLSLAACHRSSEGMSATPTPSPAAATASATATATSAPLPDTPDAAAARKPETAPDEKVQAYTRIGEDLRGFISEDSEFFARRRAEQAAQVRQGDFTKIRTDDRFFFGPEQLDGLRSTLEMPGQAGELDASAAELLTTLDTHLPNWRELRQYNEARAYERDQGSKGRRMLPGYVTGIDAVEGAVKKFEARIRSASEVATEAAMAKYRADGLMMEVHTRDALELAEQALKLFNTTDDFKDDGKLAKADGLIADMEGDLKAFRSEYARRLDSNDPPLPRVDLYDVVDSNLTAMVGHYRAARQDPLQYYYAVDSYNMAVDTLEIMNR
ncbi:DUF3829 domain-containing protein [Pseudoxanthomonas composti]|uniref:DUF3829 domain-containing protein n=2 Tax=Pseudoxanthomonas composti TaxID=2137479 RepID=A0A4Q1JUX4_9GAMM|nr:DUF3829 domain-containing protein [Pseudoxanthomonas composti]